MENTTIVSAMNKSRQSPAPAAGHAPDFGNYVVDAEGMFTVDRALFSEPGLFELEMQSIFESVCI